MSERHRERRHRSRSYSPPRPSRNGDREDWRNVRIKEEPLSDVEGTSSRRHHDRDNRDRHSRSKSRERDDYRDRSRSHRDSRDHHHHRERYDHRPINVKSEPRNRSR